MINGLARFPTRLDNVYFANNKQASIALFTAVFCFTNAEHYLIKLKQYNNWSAEAVNSVLCEIQWNQSNLLTLKTSINQSSLKAHVIEITKACIVAFMKARNFIL